MTLRHKGLALLAAVATAACGQSAPALLMPIGDSCPLLDPGATARDTITVALVDAVDVAHAPAPATEAERLVFGMFYETLTRLDCGGSAKPGLAKAWSIERDDQHWRIILRSNATFSDGSRVTGADVVASLAGHLGARDSLTAPDAQTVLFTLAQPDSELPRRLADPAFAVSKAVTGSAPLGTTPFRVTEWTTDHVAGVPVNGTLRTVFFRLAPGGDARDLLDQNADVVLTDDPAALEYARGRDAFLVVPLPWAWTYVLVGPSLTGAVSDVTQGAVRGDVRAALPPFPWTDTPRCPAAAPIGASATALRRIAYPAADRVARDLAGRLVALAASGQALEGGAVLALPLAGDAFDLSMAARSEFAFVAPVPRKIYAHCYALPRGAVTALVDARANIVIRHGTTGLALEWDGTPRLLVRQ